MTGTIFLSYRRDDSMYISGRIREHLEHRYGPAHVTFDVDSIPLGQDFRTYLRSQLENCDLMLVVIGPNWVTITDQQGNLRLHQPDDFVRMEVEAGLERGIPVVPLLINGAVMPDPTLLPESLRLLVARQSFAIRPDPSFSHDMTQLMDRLEQLTINLAPKFAQSSITLKPNVLLVGPTGVGKSSLIDALLMKKGALIDALLMKKTSVVGPGKPVANSCTMYEYDSLCVIDTFGLESGSGDSGLAPPLVYLADSQKRAFSERDHMIWYSVDALKAHFTSYDEQLVRHEFGAFPVIIVLTKCEIASDKALSAFEAEINNFSLPNVVATVRIAADPLPVITRRPFGIDELVRQTLEYFRHNKLGVI